MSMDYVDPTTQALERAQAVLPPGGPRISPRPAQQSPTDQLVKSFAESQRRQEALISQEEREKAPAIEAAIAENRKSGPAVPKLERETEPPKSNIQEQMQSWLMPMVALSALAGAFTRQHASTALNAFAAGINGLKEGNLLLYDQKLKEWKAANEKVIQNNEAALKEYNAAWNNRKLSIDQKMNEIQLISAKYQDRLTYEAAAQKNFTLVAQILQKQENLTEKLSLEYQKMKMQAEANEARLALLIQRQKMGMMDDAAIDKLVERRLSGDKSVLTNLGRGAQGPENIARFNEKLAAKMQEQSITGADLAKIDQQYTGGFAYQRTAGTMAARVENATNEVEALIPQAVETSRALPRVKWVAFNKLAQKFEAGTSDPRYYDFMVANFSLMNAYTRAMNPQGVPRVNDRLEQHAIGMLSQATDQKTYEVQVNRLWQEVKASKGAVSKTREGIQPAGESPIPPSAATAPAAPAAPAAPTVGTVQQGYRFMGGNPASPENWQKVQ